MNEPIFCPFCGGEAVQETGEEIFYDEPIKEYECVFCKECGATIKGKTAKEVIALWNRRWDIPISKKEYDEAMEKAFEISIKYDKG